MMTDQHMNAQFLTGDVGDEQQHVGTGLTASQESEAAKITGMCADGMRCGPTHCPTCPNTPATGISIPVPEYGEEGCLNTKCIDCGESLRAGERVQCDFCAGVEDLFVYDVQQRIDNKELGDVDDTDVVESDHIADVSKMVGRKFDSDKPRFDLIPPRAEEMLAKVLTFGAKKYAPGNWQHVDNAETRYIAAALRHINAQRTGEHSDPETGLPHLAHAMCCLAFVVELQEREFASVELELSLREATQ